MCVTSPLSKKNSSVIKKSYEKLVLYIYIYIYTPNTRADKYKKCGPQSYDCRRVKIALFHQSIITMIKIPNVCFKPMCNN